MGGRALRGTERPVKAGGVVLTGHGVAGGDAWTDHPVGNWTSEEQTWMSVFLL